MNSLNRARLPLLFLAAFFASVCSLALGQVSPSLGQAVEGILVLKNGNLLRGLVQQSADSYVVSLPKGTLQVRAKQVDMFCRNVEEAYLRRRETRGGSSLDAHLELATWCLRHDLIEFAEKEYQAAVAVDADHPRVARLERRLRQSRLLATRKKERKSATVVVAPKEEPLDEETLDKAPRWARALFVRQIQPLMVHSCATGGCHSAGANRPVTSESFYLNRLATDGAGHPEITLRNLEATLEQIDWHEAGQSNLLKRAMAAHGTKNVAKPLPPHKMKVLTGWVEQLAEAYQQAEADELKTVPQLAEVTPTMPAKLPLPKINASQETGQVRVASYEPIDRYDARAFNAQYAPEPKQASTMKMNLSTSKLVVPHVLTPTFAPGSPTREPLAPEPLSLGSASE